jgi:hypothetical protein
LVILLSEIVKYGINYVKKQEEIWEAGKER